MIENCWRCGTLTTVENGRCVRCNLDLSERKNTNLSQKLQPLMLDVQTIRKLAYQSKEMAAGMVGSSARAELEQIEQLANVVVARVLEAMVCSCDRTLFSGSNEITRSYSPKDHDDGTERGL